ncbi:hypothetical protein C7999DRAFT_44331 [Corynascus novoguineensis]|uniref:Survival Motor Neuron Gemin2-binding domain-containing protein n=1 Tax=Corynascus novoguineensis TaxID=1126955 RepID=A0AAN7CME7_9PEZI|nr:hypothetical protein C7999DRAFT_44331 [Corynascus novoguineensis]
MDSETAATHEEIWDDSVLVESWNQALEEYKKYHSIHARGGTIDDLPNGADETARPEDNAKPGAGVVGEAAQPKTGAEAEGKADETIPMEESDETSVPTISDVHDSVAAQKQADAMLTGGPTMPGPTTVLGTIQDEELKKLLMSWYYAGYYTGLYEGKQQRSQ